MKIIDREYKLKRGVFEIHKEVKRFDKLIAEAWKEYLTNEDESKDNELIEKQRKLWKEFLDLVIDGEAPDVLQLSKIDVEAVVADFFYLMSEREERFNPTSTVTNSKSRGK